MFFSPARPFLIAITLAAALAGSMTFTTHAEAAGKKKRDPIIAIRFHAQVMGFDSTFAAKVRVGNPPREVIVEKIPSISEREISSFYPYKAADGSYAAVLKLDRHGETILEAVSIEKRGSLLVLVVNSRPVTSMLVDKVITDGIIYIASGLTEANIRAMGASFTIMGTPETGRKSPALSQPAG